MNPVRTCFFLLLAGTALAAPTPELRLRVASLRDRRGPVANSCELALRLVGDMATDAIAYRVELDRVVDDTGTDLEPLNNSATFQPFTAGEPNRRTLRLQFSSPTRGATTLERIDGRVELTMADPETVVTISQVSATLGEPIQDPSLASAGIAVVLFDKIAVLKHATPSAPNPDPLTDVRPTSAVTAMDATSIFVRIRDPQQRVLKMDLVGRHTVTFYNGSNTWNPDVREFTYRIGEPLAADSKLVVYLVSSKPPTVLPLHLTHLALP